MTFPLALMLLFIGLKLAGIIAWSWLWVFSPIAFQFAALFAVELVKELRKAAK